MGFVPVTGTATFRPAVPPRDSVVEFVDERRTVALPVRAAIPVLTKAHSRDDLDPSVALLSGAALLGMRLVAAGSFEPAPVEDGSPPSWRVSELSAQDEDRVRMLARSRAADGWAVEEAEAVVRAVLDAVADAVPRGAPVAGSRVAAARPAVPRPAADGVRRGAGRDAAATFQERLQQRLARHRDTSALSHLVTVSLRVEADEEELVAGSVRLVLQVHDERDPLHLADAASLWLDEPEVHGFGDRARTHATIALRAAAEAWPVLDRFLELRVPDQLTLDAEEIADLLEHGVGALAARGVDVLWPRALGRDLTTRAVLDTAPRRGQAQEAPLQTGLLTPDAVFAFSWEVALGGDPLTGEEMAQLASAAAPIMKLRGAWTVVDPSVARKARKRLVREVRPAEAVAAALSGVATLGGAAGEEPAQVVVGASLLHVRERLLAAASREPVDPPAGLQATLRDYQRHGLTWLSDLTGLGLGACLADDMGLGKTLTLIALHLRRAEASRAEGRPPAPTLVVCPTSLLGNWEAEVRRFAPGVPVRRFHGGTRSLAGLGVGGADAEPDLLTATEAGSGGTPVDDPGFVLTTYGTMRVDTTGPGGADGSELAAVPWGLVVADEAQHVKNSRSSTARGLRSIPHGARVALTGTPVENDLTELWSILDWCVPGLLGSRQAFRRVWASPIEAGVDPEVTKRFADLIGPFLLRRRKSDPGIAPELPPKTETDHPLSLTREQVVLYEAFVRETMERIERADEHARRGLVLSLLTGCKQICNHPAHFLKQGGGRIAGRSEKIDLLDELLGTVLAEDGAALVFTQYVEMARLVARHLTHAGIPHQLLHGGTPVREREAMVRRFQSDGEDRVPVFLLSLKAGGTGLNLTRAEHVIHLDRWWNPAVEDQATDRAYRIGQTRPVQVHRMVTRGTIEERVGLLLGRKRALADAVLGRGEAALTELSDAELRDLVTLRPEPLG